MVSPRGAPHMLIPPSPALATRRHMFFCATLAIGLIKSGKVQSINMERETYMR